MYVPLEPFADLIKLAGSLVEQAPDEGFTDVSCLTELFVCYPIFFQISKFLLNLLFVIVSKRISTCSGSSVFSFLILKRFTSMGTYENLMLAMFLDHLVTDGIFKLAMIMCLECLVPHIIF